MRKSEIQENCYYTDGKQGLRQVIALQLQVGEEPLVHYRVLSGRQQAEEADTSIMTLAGFAVWARATVAPDGVESFLLGVEARRLAPRLTPRQMKYLKALRLGEAQPADWVTERTAQSCLHKGLIERSAEQTLLTPLGREVAGAGADEVPPLKAGDVKTAHFDLLLQGTHIGGAGVIAALYDHLVGGVSQGHACEEHGVSRSQFSRRLELLRKEHERAARLSAFYRG